eukprot:c11458_g1_i1 orf=2-562(-)
MAGTIQELWNVGSVKRSEQKECWCQHEHRKSRRRKPHDLLLKESIRDPSQWRDNRNIRVRPACPDLKQNGSMESLWVAGRYGPSLVGKEPRRRELPVSTRDEDGVLCAKREETIHDKALFCNADFVALLRACAKNKDLYTGTRIHDAIMKRGLLKKCSDALVAMYAKCGALAKAQALLDLHKSRDVF